MNKLWRVASFEYKRNVFKKSFIFTLLSVPFIIACCVGVGLFIESSRVNSNMIGYVDHAGVLKKKDYFQNYMISGLRNLINLLSLSHILLKI